MRFPFTGFLALLLDLLFPARADEKIIRDLSAESFLVHLAPVLVPETRPETIGLMPFSNREVKSALHEAKYRGNERAFALLAAVLAEYLADTDRAFVEKRALIPVPLGEMRHAERGFNQVEEVAKIALGEVEARGLHIPLLPHLLVRTRETVSQVSLPRRAREENMRGAFRAGTALDPNTLYIVLDDVTTTGATLQAAIDALKSGGAVHLLPVALAH